MNRFHYHYIEGDRVLRLDVESNIKGEDVFLASAPAWEAPHECELISAEEAAEIMSRIEKALCFMGTRHRIVIT
jgi:hypothetical protein